MDYTGATSTDNTLTTLHRPASVFSCTEAGCDAAFRSEVWTTVRRSLERHLQEAHDIKIVHTRNICRGCDADLGTRPSRHRCAEPIPEPTTPAPTCRHSCPECNLAFPSRLGLQNHLRQHNIDARRRQLRTPLARPRTRRTLRVRRRQPEDDSTSDAESVASRTRSRQDRPQTPEGTPELSPIPASPAGITPPAMESPHQQAHDSGDESTAQQTPEENSQEDAEEIPVSQMDDTTDLPNQTQNTTVNLSTNFGASEDGAEERVLAQFDEDLQRTLREPATNASWIRFVITLEDIIKTVQYTLGIRLNPAPTQRRTDRTAQDEATEAIQGKPTPGSTEDTGPHTHDMPG